MWARGRVACEPSCHSMVKRVPLALAESTSPSRRRPLRSHDTRRPSSSCTMIGALLTGGGGRLAVAAGASGTSSSSRMSARVTCATFGCGSNSGCVNPMGCVAVKVTTMGGNRCRNLVIRARNHDRPPAGPKPFASTTMPTSRPLISISESELSLSESEAGDGTAGATGAVSTGAVHAVSTGAVHAVSIGAVHAGAAVVPAVSTAVHAIGRPAVNGGGWA